jgi:dihydrofolate reductase
MYDLAGAWGGSSPFDFPAVIVTHRTDDAPDPSSGFTFVDGFDAALATAREIAGDRDVNIGGGASVIQQAFAAGVVDRLRLHISPVILGGGRPLFGELGQRFVFEPIGVTQSQYATHLDYRVSK